MSLTAEIHKQFSGFRLDISVAADNNIVGLLGASGSGKSMTLRCIAGIETPDSGRIVLNDRVLFDSEKKINLPPRKRRVGYLFQNYALFPNMTVEQNIAAGLVPGRDDAERIVKEMVGRFRLEGLEKRYPSQLSGGQQQRVALARILAYGPDVIMLDEPFSALDTYLREQLQMQVLEVLSSYGGDVLLVTHSRDELYRFCEESVVLENGQAVSGGKTEELFRRPGHVTAARLTGCKNISPIRKLGARRLLALDWGLELETAEDIGEDITHAGIRAHEFFPAEGGGNNVFRGIWRQTLRDPFEWTLSIVPVTPDGGEAPGNLWWKIDYKDAVVPVSCREGDMLTVGISPENILLLKS